MKKDAVIAVLAIIVVGVVCFGLAAMRPPFVPTPSVPFTTAPVGPTVTGHIVMRVNGEPVTEAEFQAAFDQLPDDMKRQFSSGPGKQAFAEQLVRMKLLEQEGRRMGVDKAAAVEAAIAANQMDIIARATADKLVANPSKEAVQTFYNQNSGKFQTIDVSHILIAYSGGGVPPRDGGVAPNQVAAMNKALMIAQRLKAGADFGQLVKQYSDDTSTIEQGGHLGNFGRGMLPPDIEAKVWQLEPGQISDPVGSRFGIHIFKVNAKKVATLPQVSANIERHVKQQNTFDRVEILRKNAKVDFDPKFFPDAKSWPANGAGKRPS